MLHIIHYGKPKVHEIEDEMVMTYRKILAVELLFDSANKVKVCPSKTNTRETDKPRDQMESSRGETSGQKLGFRKSALSLTKNWRI